MQQSSGYKRCLMLYFCTGGDPTKVNCWTTMTQTSEASLQKCEGSWMMMEFHYVSGCIPVCCCQSSTVLSCAAQTRTCWKLVCKILCNVFIMYWLQHKTGKAAVKGYFKHHTGLHLERDRKVSRTKYPNQESNLVLPEYIPAYYCLSLLTMYVAGDLELILW